MAPSVALRSTMARNCSGVCRRLRALMVAFRPVPGAAGRSPSWPTATCVFCASIADFTSAGVSAYFTSFAGSSQMRIAYLAPSSVVSPTPSMRLIGSSTWFETKSAMSVPVTSSRSDTKA